MNTWKHIFTVNIKGNWYLFLARLLWLQEPGKHPQICVKPNNNILILHNSPQKMTGQEHNRKLLRMINVDGSRRKWFLNVGKLSWKWKSYIFKFVRNCRNISKPITYSDIKFLSAIVSLVHPKLQKYFYHLKPRTFVACYLTVFLFCSNRVTNL